MRLGDWMSERHMTAETLAGLMGVDESTVTRLIPKPGKKQIRKPGWELIKKIATVTNGAVTANDFMDATDDDDPSDTDEAAA